MRRVIRFLMKWTMIASAGVAPLLFILWVISPSSYDSTPLTNRLLAAGPNPARVADVMSDHDWDMVCHLGPYSNPSDWLPRYLQMNLKGFTYEPYDEWIGEEDVGFSFIDLERKIIYTYVVDHKIIERITGPQCIVKEKGYFIVKSNQGWSGPFNSLVFID